MTVRTYVCTMAALTCGIALPLAAQQPVPVAPPAAQPPAPPQNIYYRRDGVTLDFNEADLRAVITAIAQAGRIDFTYSDIPPKKISLHAHLAPGRDNALSLLRQVVKANDLYMTERNGLYFISFLPLSTDTSTTSSYVLPDTQLFVYRLKHANATRLSQVLQAIFNGGGNPGGTGTLAHRTLSQSLSSQGQGQGPMGFGGGGFGGGGGAGGGGGFGGGLAGLIQNQLGQGGGNDQGQGAANGVRGNGRSRITIVPEEQTNSLLVRSDSADWAVVKQAIDAVDIRPLQVLIEVMIVEVQRNEDLNFGISGNGSNQRTFGGRSLGSARLPGDTSSASNFIANFTRYGAVNVNLALSALQTRGDVHIQSLPLVFAENNTESHLLVGSQQPFVQSYTTTPTISTAQNNVVQYRDVGTSLAILPTINPDGYVNLQVQQEVSAATTQVQFGAPVISTREASASLFVKDGQTMVVGGLTDNQEQHTRTGIPLLSSLPLVGGLFGSTQHSNVRTELFLFLTPHIVQDDDDVERIRSAIREKAKLLHDVPFNPYIKIDSTAPVPSSSGSASSPLQTIPLPKHP